MTDKVVFLDLDGVLNSEAYLRTLPPRRAEHPWDGSLDTALDPAAVARLNRLTDATGAGLVVSSSWRTMLPWDHLLGVLRTAGVTGVVLGATPEGGSRGDEIGAWLDEHPEVFRWVILDDRGDMGDLAFSLVRTTWATGLQDEHVARAVEFLSGG